MFKPIVSCHTDFMSYLLYIIPQIATQVAEVHRKFEEEENRLRENHRRQMKELGQRHAKEAEKQLASYHDDLKIKDDDNRKICQEYEDK